MNDLKSLLLMKQFSVHFSDNQDIMTYYFNQNSSFFDVQRLLEALDDTYQNEIEEIAIRAQRLLNQQFVFDEEWDMERCQTNFHLNFPIQWEESQNNDPEWMWMLNRHSYLLNLLYQYLLTNDSAYLVKLIAYMEDWINYHSKPVHFYKMTSCRTIDTGIRLLNWVKILSILFEKKSSKKYVSEATFSKIVTSIFNQCDFLMINGNLNISPISNWKILEMQGMVAVCALFPEWKQSQTYMKKSLDYIVEATNLQINPDGFHWEASSMYHHEVFLALLNIDNICRKVNQSISIRSQLEKMLSATIALTKPDRTQSPFGDSDVECLQSLFTKAALVLSNGEGKYFGEEHVSISNYLFYGKGAFEKYQKIQSTKPSKTKFFLQHTGLVFLRDSWERNSNFTMFTCGPQGGGHGHCDLMHFEIQAGEDYLLTDSGRFSYREDTAYRKLFKGESYHNVPMVDFKGSTIQTGSWTFGSVAHSLPMYVSLNKEIDYIESAHLGYMTNEMNVFTQRKLFKIGTGLWIVIDYFHTNEEHTYQQLFQTSKENIEKIKDSIYAIHGKKHTLFINGTMNVESTFQLEKSQYSPRYNEKYSSNRLIQMSHSPILITLLSLDRQLSIQKEKIMDLNNQEVKEKFVSGIKINDKNQTHYLIVNHLEDQTSSSRKSYQLKNYHVHGRAVYLREENECLQRKVILK